MVWAIEPSAGCEVPGAARRIAGKVRDNPNALPTGHPWWRLPGAGCVRYASPPLVPGDAELVARRITAVCWTPVSASRTSKPPCLAEQGLAGTSPQFQAAT